MPDDERLQLSRKLDGVIKTLQEHSDLLRDLKTDVGDLKKKVAPLDADRTFKVMLWSKIAQIIGFLGLLGGSVTIIPLLWDAFNHTNK